MGMAPETMVSPMAQAPPDRPSRTVEQIAREFIAALFQDGGLDPSEMKIVRDTFRQIQMRIQAGQVIGATAQSQQQQAAGPGPSPLEQNVDGAEDYGSGQGDPRTQDDNTYQ